MTMLTHYNEILREELALLPLLPGKDEGLILKRNNLIAFSVGGDMVGPATANGVWDPGSYGKLFLLNQIIDFAYYFNNSKIFDHN
jgi:hypothetical protein